MWGPEQGPFFMGYVQYEGYLHLLVFYCNKDLILSDSVHYSTYYLLVPFFDNIMFDNTVQ